MPLKTMWLILTTPLQTYELGLVHFVASEQFGVVAEVAEEPVQLPHGLRAAIKTAGNELPANRLGSSMISVRV